VLTLLDRLGSRPGPASQMRVLRMRGREAPGREALLASAQWRDCRQWLDRCERPPELRLQG
jgi:hypothetical protein